MEVLTATLLYGSCDVPAWSHCGKAVTGPGYMEGLHTLDKHTDCNTIVFLARFSMQLTAMFGIPA